MAGVASFFPDMTLPFWVQRRQTCAEVRPPSNNEHYNPVLSKALVVYLEFCGAIATLLQATAFGARMLVV